MIRSFRSRALRQFAQDGDRSKLSVQNVGRIRRILERLDAAKNPQEMDVAGLQFHPLRGGEKGRFSVWVTGNWRITFAWEGEDAKDVDLEDYH